MESNEKVKKIDYSSPGKSIDLMDQTLPIKDQSMFQSGYQARLKDRGHETLFLAGKGSQVSMKLKQAADLSGDRSMSGVDQYHVIPVKTGKRFMNPISLRDKGTNATTLQPKEIAGNLSLRDIKSERDLTRQPYDDYREKSDDNSNSSVNNLRYVSVPCRFKGWKTKEMSAVDNASLNFTNSRKDINENQIKNRDRGVRAFNLINSTREVPQSNHMKTTKS